jgi:NAD(P)-dependent dehydrogenase (short-subunit alcohol dehydrogenase family)
VNAVCPGFVETAMTGPGLRDPSRRARMEDATPLRRLGRPDDVAGAVAFLLSDDATWITGVALPVDGGYTCR